MEDELTIVHFNDVYHLSDHDLITRFASLVDQVGKSAPNRCLRLFSGDVFSPSLEASVLRGEHMTQLLNDLEVDVACYGNHDFDFGEQRLVELSDKTQFPWVLSNAFGLNAAGSTGSLLARSHEYVIRHIGEFKFGIVGLGGTDWPSNCQHLPPSTIAKPYVIAKKIATHLRTALRCDFVIALTHMRLAEDLEVSRETEAGPGKIDLILGGHDHHVIRRFASENNDDPECIQESLQNEDISNGGEIESTTKALRVVKSGTDWNGISIVRLTLNRDTDGIAVLGSVQLRQVLKFKEIPEYSDLDQSQRVLHTLQLVERNVAAIAKQPLVHTGTTLEGRSSIIRSQETNLGNFLADMVRAFYNADIALVNSGAVRCDREIAPTRSRGRPLSMRDMVDICPFDNAFVVKEVLGAVLIQALENSISDTHTDGRFLQLSGIRIKATWSRTEGHRILDAIFVPERRSSDRVRPDQIYSVAMVDFIASGFDGYSCFKNAPKLTSEEAAMTDTNMLLTIFGQSKEKRKSPLDDVDLGMERARAEIIKGWNKSDGLPIIEPAVDGRITFIDTAKV